MLNKKSQNRIVLINLISTFLIQGLNFFAVPVFSRMMGPDNYGVVSVFLTTANIVMIIFSLETSDALAVAKNTFTNDRQFSFQSSIIFLSTISFLIGGIILIFSSRLFQSWKNFSVFQILFILAYAWGAYCVNFINAIFSYEFLAGRNAIISITLMLGTMTSSFILIKGLPKEINFYGRIISLAGVYFLFGIGICVYLLSKGKTFYNKEFWEFTLPITIPTIFHLLAMQVLGQCDILMIRGMLSNYYVGIYSLTRTFSSIISILYGVFNNSWVPFYYDYTREGRFDELREHAENYLELFTILCMGFILVSREIFSVFSSSEYYDGIKIIPLFIIGYYMVFLYSFPVNYEILHRKTKAIAACTILAAVSNVILNYIFIKCMGYQGAVYATAISHGIQFLSHIVYAKLGINDKFPYPIKMFVKWIFLLFSVLVFGMLFKNNSIFRWGLGSLLGIYLMINTIKRKTIF